MTSLSLKKPRTIAPRKRAATAISFAGLLVALAVAGSEAAAQAPASAGEQPVAATAPSQKIGARPPVLGGYVPNRPKDIEEFATLPSRDIIFSMPNDARLEVVIAETIRKDLKRRNVYDTDPNVEKTLKFPIEPNPTAGIAYKPKTSSYPPMQEVYDALYIVHRRLHFEDKNSERYGWDLGIVQPLVSTAIFYKDVFMFPNSLASGCAYGFWDSNAGKCLPGSPTPYMLYPPELTITGGVVEGVVITGAAFAFP